MKKILHWKVTKIILLSLLSVIVLAITFPPILYFTVSRNFRPNIYDDVTKVPKVKTALVLGAGLKEDGTPSDILEDRVLSAVHLYQAGKVQKVIFSGDNSTFNHNEPSAMKKLAVKMGVPDKDIQVDDAGLRTYDSCWRVKNIFSQAEVIIVTQSFHITRSMFICQGLGVKVTGFVSDSGTYPLDQWNYWKFRDMIALTKSAYDLYLNPPKVIAGEKINLDEN